MGKPKRRMAPSVVNHVNRNLESLTFPIVVNAVKSIHAPWEPAKRGRKPHPPRVVVVCCILMIMFNQTYDGIESRVKDNETLKRCLRVRKLPGHSVIERGMKRLSMVYIRKLMRMVILKYRRSGMAVAVDSSGFSLKSSSKYFDIRIRRINSRRDFLKLHICIDVNNGLVHYFTITDWHGSDPGEFKRLLRYLPQIARVLGDSAYSSRKNCNIVVEKKGRPYLMFKVNATGKAKGSPGWKESYCEYNEEEENWLAQYHLRSMIESVFGSIKRRWGSIIRSRLGWMKRRELSLKVLCYDIKQVLYLNRAHEIGTNLWVEL